MVKKIKVQTIIDIVLLVLFSLVIFRGQTKLIYISNYLVLIIGVLLFLCICMDRKYIKFSYRLFPLFVFLIYYIMSIAWSYDREHGLFFVKCMFLPAFFILLHNYTDNFWDKMIKTAIIISNIVAFSILLEVINPRLFINIFGFIIAFPQQALNGALKGEYTGIVGGNQHATVIMIMGICAILSKCYSRDRISIFEILDLVLLFISIVFTTKRMLTVLAAMFIFCFFIFFMKKYRKIIILLSGCVLASVILIMLLFDIDFISILMSFFSGEESSDVFSGRTYFWKVCIEMFNEKTLLGYGLGSFNSVYYVKTSYLFQGAPWSYEAHNIYAQILAEAGIIGFSLFLFQIFISLKNAILIFKNKKINYGPHKEIVFFSMSSLLVLLLYGITGNVIYSTNEFVWLVLSFSGLNFTSSKVDAKLLTKKNE